MGYNNLRWPVLSYLMFNYPPGAGAGADMPTIFHLIDRAAWESAQAQGEHRAESLAAEGFIHCSQDTEQMLRVALRLYAGRSDMMALELDTERLTSPVQREPSRSGEIYPHIYGPLNLDAVVKVWQLSPDANGGYSLEPEPGGPDTA